MTIIMDTPEAIMYYHMMSQRSALKLEILGMRFKGGSVCAHIKRTYGITAHLKKDVLAEFNALIEERFPGRMVRP